MRDLQGRGEEATRGAVEAIGRYRLERMLGEGGQGRVFLARDPGDGRALAIKVARRAERDLQAGLRREIQVLSELAGGRVPGAVELVDHGEQNGLLWLAMEYIEGPSFDRVLRVCEDVTGVSSDTVPVDRCSSPVAQTAGEQSSLPSRERLLPVVRDLAATLASLHALGLVHGDVKPQNLLIPDDGPPVLIDFGNARRTFLEQPDQAAPFDGLPVIGTPSYMAPEHSRGHVDPRADAYGLGCMFFEVLLGVSFQGSFKVEPRTDLNGWPDAETLDGLRRWLEQLLERDPARRLARLDGLVADLDRWLGSQFPRVEQPRVDWSPFVGRERELAQLDQALSQVVAGGSYILGVCGEAGCGKTRLLNEMASRATAVGLSVDESLATALADDALSSVPREAADGAKARLVVIDQLEQRQAGLRANLRALRVDDLPPSTLLLLGWRSAHAFAAPPTSATVHLGGLSRDATLSLARALLGGPASVELVDRLIAKTGGSPARVWQLLDLWLRAGAVSRMTGTEPFRFTVSADQLGSKVARVQAARIQALAPRTRAILHLACILGPQFRKVELGWVAVGYGEEELRRCVDELVAADLLVERDKDLWRLQDPGLLEPSAFPDGMPDQARYLALAAAYKDGAARVHGLSPRMLATQARLFSRAGRHALAVPLLVRAGELAQRARDRFQARNWYRQALDEAAYCTDDERAQQRAVRQHCHVALADLLTRAGDHEEADRMLAAAQADASDDVERARLLRLRATNFQEGRRYEEAERAFALVSNILPSRATAEQLELCVARFWHHYFSRRQADAMDHLAEELNRFSDADVSPSLRCSFHQCLAAWHLVRSAYSSAPQAISHARASWALVENNPELSDRRGLALFYLGFPLLWAGKQEDLVEATERLQAAVRECDDLQERSVVSKAQLYHAVAQRRLGLVDTTRSLAREALTIAEEIGSPALRGAALSCLSWAAYRDGELSAAEHLAEQACAQWQQGKIPYPFQWLLCFPRAELQRVAGQPEQARSTLARLLAEDQHRLPADLHQAIAGLSVVADSASLRPRLRQVIHLAARYRYL